MTTQGFQFLPELFGTGGLHHWRFLVSSSVVIDQCQLQGFPVFLPAQQRAVGSQLSAMECPLMLTDSGQVAPMGFDLFQPASVGVIDIGAAGKQ